MKTTKLLLAGLITLNFGLGTFNSRANNVAISNVAVAGSDITFDISWENSWYASGGPNNWDAVWVFVKYKDCATSNWLHADLSTVPANHSVAGGVLQVDTVPDGKGVFIRRSATGSGNIASSAVSLRLNIGAGTYDFKVFGIEMVHIRNEDFVFGDNASTDRFYNQTGGMPDTIFSEAAIAKVNLGNTGVEAGGVPAAFPKGWDSFYCMKYEISQEQYAKFLNTLTYDQQDARTTTSPNNARGNFAMVNASDRYRNYIQIDTPGVASTTPAYYSCNLDGYVAQGTGAFDAVMNEANDGMSLACNFLSWYDLIAYLDWSGLRPFTDLEFEKICRGPAGWIFGEYPWGNISLTGAYSNTGLLLLDGEAGEYYNSTLDGLCAYLVSVNADGPLRVGFASTATSTRVKAGASFYGVLDMAGNVWERVVAVDVALGTGFTGTLGDGTLDASGDATNADWPGVSGADGWGRRGGGFYTNSGNLRTSDRQFAYSNDATRNYEFGGRGVRDW